MRKTIMAWSACAAALLPALAATTASADGLPAGVGQSSTSQQSASSTGTSTQAGASNQAINVAILSPGAAAGAVTQANNSSASSNAGNTNNTTQTAPQSGGGGVQAVGQAAYNQQAAQSAATSTQTNPSNQAINVSILSPGSGGSGAVNQSNNSGAGSNAGNSNATTQTAPQSGGGGGGGGSVQGVGQLAENQQSAASTATSTQDHPSNTAVNLTILSGAKGHEEPKVAVPVVIGGGAVTQANNSGASSNAGNTNTTTQTAPQSGGGMIKKESPCCSPGGYPGVQGVGQLATNQQSAASTATSTQYSPSNTAIDLPILSPYSGGGAVNQANNSGASSNAGNTNRTTQFAPQSGGGWPGILAAGQEAHNTQNAWSAATSTQFCPVNVTAGPFGAVTQANNSFAGSNAGNTNTTNQNAPQAGWWPLSL
jgi:hypothetical protein